MGREAPLQKTCRRIAGDRGAFGVKLNPTNGAGLPDFVFCYRGFYCAWEFKAPTATTNPGRRRLQEHNLAQILQAGGRAQIIDRPDQARAFLDAIDYAATSANL